MEFITVLAPRNAETRTYHTLASIREKHSVNTLNIVPETQKLINDLEQLSLDERKTALLLSHETLFWKIKEEIDCMGCSSRLQSYVKELAEVAQNKGKSLNFDGFLVLPNAEISKYQTIQHFMYTYTRYL